LRRGALRKSLAAFLGSLCVATPLRGEPDPVRVYAAASLTDLVTTLAARWGAAPVAASFGASSELARQIADGAPADVFLSASPEWIDFLDEAGKLAGEPLVFARGELVCIAADPGALRARGVVDAASLLEKGLTRGDRVAIADAAVPAGAYARQALASLGLAEAYRPRLVGQKDVRAVLNAVEKGELPAGFVYATDARAAGLPVLFPFDPKGHAPIEYLAAVVAPAARADSARAFVEFLSSDTARAELTDLGFRLP
jgi:molybdate transport system substrate-binding protein